MLYISVHSHTLVINDITVLHHSALKSLLSILVPFSILESHRLSLELRPSISIDSPLKKIYLVSPENSFSLALSLTLSEKLVNR